jgi:hypothetical protein
MLYLKSAEIEGEEFELIRSDLLGMAQEAQMSGESLADRIGNDVPAFCEDTLSVSRKESSLSVMQKTLQAIFWLTLVQIVINYAWLRYVQYQQEGIIEWTSFTISWNLIGSLIILMVWGIMLNKFMLKRLAGSKGKKCSAVLNKIGISFMLSFWVAEMLILVGKQFVIVETSILGVIVVALVLGLLLNRKSV